MPRFDRTGPRGMGPLTGRGLGPCGGGHGFGRGFGRRGFYYEPEPLTKKEERKVLEEEKKAIEKRLKELKE